MSISVSGNLKDVATGVVSSGSWVRFVMRGTAGNQPFVAGTALLAPAGASTWYKDFTPDATGAISGSLYSKSEVSVGGQTGVISYGMQIFVNSGVTGPEVLVDASQNININNPNLLSVLPVVAAPTGDSTYARLDAGNSPITGTMQFTTGINTKKLNAIRFADQFGSISAAIADLPASGGVVFIPAGTYTDNIVITTSGITLAGAGRGVTIIKPANTALPVLTVDATNVSTIDGFTAMDFSILPVPSTACDAGIQIKGKTNVNQANDHHIYRRLIIGNPTTNTTGTNNFRHNIEIIGRTIWSVMDNVRSYGSRGDGLHLSLSGGIVGPVNALYIKDSEFSYNYNYGVWWDGSGAVTPAQANSFVNCNIQFNGNNSALSPCAGAVFQGTDQTELFNCSFEENGAGNADTNRAHLRLTGTNNRDFNIHGGCYTNDSGTSAKYGIFADASVVNGYWSGMEFVGNAYTKAVHVAIPASGEMRTTPIIGATFNMGAPEIVVDANGNSRAMSLSPLAFPVWQIGTAQFPVSSNTVDLTNVNTATPGNIVSLTGGPYTINKITGATTGQILIIRNTSASAATLTNAFGGAGQMTFNDAANRTLNQNDSVLLYSQDGSTWNEVALGAALLGKAFSRYNNIATVSGGIPAEYATVDLTAQGAAISATTLYAVPASGAGMYRISYVASITRAGSVSSTLGGANGFQITYTDANDSVVKTSLAGPTSAANTTATLISGSIVVNAKASTNVQYLIGYTDGGGTTMQYNLHVKLEAM